VKKGLLTLAVALVLPAPAAAKVTQQTSESAGVKATLSFDCKQTKLIRDCKDFKLSITRQGVELVSNQALTPPGEEGTFPGNPDPLKSVQVADLDKNAEPEVVVDLFTGGAHCCSYSLINGYSAATGGYVRLRHVWGNAGYVLKDLDRDGVFEFLSGDDRFAYAFSSYAESRFPPQIWHYKGGRLIDVTRRFPKLVRKDARLIVRSLPKYRRQHLDLRGFLAAYQADNYLLGHRQAARGWKQLRAIARKGQIRPVSGVGPSGKRYLKSLLRFLRRLGYTR
jgi:hypothetical protein